MIYAGGGILKARAAEALRELAELTGIPVVTTLMARGAFPDMQFRVDLLIESGDLVVSNWTLTGTHTGGAFYDVAPSGEPVVINGTAILRLREGKVVEHWGGPHCMYGIGLSPARTPHGVAAGSAETRR